jgi:hypothetical protein
MEDAYKYLLENGNDLAIEDKMMQLSEFVNIVGLEEKYRIDEKYSFKKKQDATPSPEEEDPQ